MGRLFWKFFLCILLAQLAATIGIGSAFWLRDRARSQAAEIDTGPPAFIALDAAAATLKHGGLPALRGMLGEMQRTQVFVLDRHGRELLGRTVPAELVLEAQRQLASGEPQRGVRRLVGPDAQTYTAIVRRYFRGAPLGARPQADGPGEPPPGPGPGPGPGFGRRVGQVAGIVAATLASLLFAALLAWYFSRPIRALRSAFEAASAGDLAPRFTGSARAGDELSDLGRDFDRMSAQLRALMDGQRRLLHDVSHELRSPLARLQAAVGLAHQQPEKIGSSLDRIERESMRMDKLVGELLTLSRLEASPRIERREQLDLTELADEIAADARFEAGLEAPRISVDAPGVIVVQGDPDLLWSALENIVRNAMRHGGTGGMVTIALRTSSQSAYIDVLDRGPGIPAADLPSVFQPFFRANPGRSNVDGHGLGLAIAQRVVLAHGGDIRAANRDGGGLQVTLRLPLQP
ncbi:sensor histidine kinase [Massilia yuzhufengensis]|uniref:histidine kinase n=1 Tax=Massilia yuzhufengensis TaxID=1164594 RepID=A0A1I1U665_9BURK|nr:ATP-binding protein [Massilia yuzhufengensis]SFD66184.1 two-component system, OmpR family, sensor kinase [Massilia yuzhufengensis]